jgi:hypothetical protein
MYDVRCVMYDVKYNDHLVDMNFALRLHQSDLEGRKTEVHFEMATPSRTCSRFANYP